VASKLTLEGPIWKDKTSFMVSGRRTYLDLLARPIIKAQTGGSIGGYYFYDVVGKVNHRFDDRNRLFLSFYGGNDKFYLRDKRDSEFGGASYHSEDNFDLAWGNKIAALRWNHLFNNKLFFNLTNTFSTFKFLVGAEFINESTINGVKESENTGINYVSNIRDWSTKADFDWFANPNHLVRFGGYGVNHRFKPGVSRLTYEGDGPNLDTIIGSKIVDSWEFGAYIEDDFKFGERHKMNAGLHASGFLVDGKLYKSLQPRLSYRMLVNSNWAAKASFSTMYQYIHLLANTNVGLPTDLWVPSTANIRPQTSYQGAAGIARSFLDQGFELSVEGYYKYMSGLVEYKEGASFFGQNANWEDKVVQGQGWAYGGELFLQKKYGKTTGWIGYTLSWTNRQFDQLNGGEIFPFKYDRRHDFSFVLAHEFSKKFDVGLTWVYGTGNAISLPLGSFQGAIFDPINNFDQASNVNYYQGRNGYRMRPYHRLDLGANLHKEHKKFKSTWSFSVYNTYSRRNPYFLYFSYKPETNSRVLKQVSLFPIIPSVAYRFEF
jgi:hypothetical protein